jgi:hypothetical protein
MSDLDRKTKTCPLCGGDGEVFRNTKLNIRPWPCPECRGKKVVYSETAEEYEARLRAFVEQARKERDWLVKHPRCIPHRCEHQVACKIDQVRMAILDVYTPIITPEQCEQARLEMAARAVAGKEGA